MTRFCMAFVQAMKRTTDPGRRRTYQLRIQEKLIEDPYAYEGKLRKAIREEFAKGNFRNERV